jgi:glyoxylase-like metal-dependent hydrolase (beta-lactamase superfamily II)
MILECFPLGPVETNGILLASEKTKEAVAIDVPSGGAACFARRVRELSLEPVLILLTHSHWDHIVDAAALKRLWGVPLWVHAEDAGNVEAPGSDGLPLWQPIEGVRPDGLLEDGQVIAIGELSLRVIHTPGHTPGCVCFYVESEKVLISGDTLFRGTIGRVNLPTARPEKMWESLKRLAQLPPDTRVVPGHGEETTIGAESWLDRAKERFGGG